MNLIGKISSCMVLAMAAVPAYAAYWMMPATTISTGGSATTDVIFASEGQLINEVLIEIQLPSSLDGFSFVAHSVGNGTCDAEKFGTHWSLFVTNNYPIPLGPWPETLCQLETHLSVRAPIPAHTGYLFQPAYAECAAMNCNFYSFPFGYVTVHNVGPPRS